MPRPKKIVPTPGVSTPANVSYHELQEMITDHMGPPPLGLIIALAGWCQRTLAKGTNGNPTAAAPGLFANQEGNGHG